MVLQQQTKVRLWGRAKDNTEVTARGSWNNRAVTTRSDAEGRWSLLFQTPKAGFTPYVVTLSDGEAFQIHNVMIGEVWFSSSQSNMEYALGSAEQSGYYLSQACNYKNRLRMVSIQHKLQKEPADTTAAKWQDCTPQTAAPFSAVSYFFATQLCDKLQCPVGIICNALSSTHVEGWMSEQLYKDFGLGDFRKASVDDAYHQPVVMYNGMLHSLAGYTVRGFLWYQGESNSRVYYNNYAKHLKGVINLWRNEWHEKHAPFLFVEIPPCFIGDTCRPQIVREQQKLVPHIVPQ